MNYRTLSETEIWTEDPDDAESLSARGLPCDFMKEAFEWWRAVCEPGILPHIDLIDPLKIPTNALPWADLVAVTFEPLRFEIRLWGTQIVAAVGKDLKGTDFHEAGMHAAIRRLTHVVKARVPYFATIPLDWHSEKYRHSTHYSSLGLPFRDDENRVARILCFLHFGERS